MSIDIDVVGDMAAYLPVVRVCTALSREALCVCVMHCLERHCVCTAQSREALCVVNCLERHCVCTAQCREALCVYCTV